MSQELIAVGTSDKESLEILKKYCTKDACFQGMKYDDTIHEYFTVTSEVLDKEISKEIPDHSIMQTLAANLILILGNCEKASEQKQKKESITPVSFTSSQYDAKSAIKHINKYWDFTGNHDRAIQKEKNISEKWRIKRLAILLLSFVCILSIVFLIRASSDVAEYQSQIEEAEKGIKIFRKDTNQIKQNKRQAKMVFNISIVCIILCLSTNIIIIYRHRKQRLLIEKEKKEWRNYFLLCRLFETTEHKIKEGQKTWSGQ